MMLDPGPNITALYGVWINDELGFAVDNLRNVELTGTGSLIARVRVERRLAVSLDCTHISFA